MQVKGGPIFYFPIDVITHPMYVCRTAFDGLQLALVVLPAVEDNSDMLGEGKHPQAPLRF